MKTHVYRCFRNGLSQEKCQNFSELFQGIEREITFNTFFLYVSKIFIFKTRRKLLYIGSILELLLNVTIESLKDK